MKLKDRIHKGLNSFSFVGLLCAGLFFAASLTPSLVPRPPMFQGALGGLCLALGYGLGVFISWLWLFVELPKPKDGISHISRWITTIGVSVIITYFLWRGTEWQNSIRALMDMEPVAEFQPFSIALVAIIVGLLFVGLGRLIGHATFKVYSRLERIIPRRLAVVSSAIILGVLLINIFNGVVAKYTLRLLDSSYQALDTIIDDGIRPPVLATRSGSVESVVNWEDLGRRGREFVRSGPSIEQLSVFSGGAAKEPIRLYVGLNSAETIHKRAKLAVQELIRTNAFDRKVLMVITPTGTGWVDPMSSDPFEYMHNGDTALVAVQYSYLASYLSLLTEPELVQETARALFKEIYTHWTTLPKDARPKLFLHGLSLGSLGSETSMRIHNLIEDPIQGALWSGPTFLNRIWRTVTNERNHESSAWLPKFGDGSLVRFTSQKNNLSEASAPWGPVRIVYLQYASDSVTFFDPKSAYARPAWMAGERGPDVSPEFTWYPVITFMQLLLDLGTSMAPPTGYGHTYAAEHYIDGWVAVSNPEYWDDKQTMELKKLFSGEVN